MLIEGFKIRKKSVFFTGFPGFIGKRLIKALVSQSEQIKIYALVIESVKSKAEKEVKNDPVLKDEIQIIIGDITEPNLGLDSGLLIKLTNKITDIFHLAAIYHLEVPKKLAWDVNVKGTFNVLKFALKCKNLFSFTHFSSMVAPGRAKGQVKEDELNTDVSLHNNHYEITKHVSEYLVRKYSDRLPIIIIRPAIVIGDSESGVTDKFDGAYHIFELTKGGKDIGKYLPRINIKDSNLRIPIAPVDYLAKSVAYISDQEGCIGHTFHLGEFRLYVNDFFDIILGKKSNQSRLIIPNKLLNLIIHSPIYRYLMVNKFFRLVLRKGLQVPVEILDSMDSYDTAIFETKNNKRFLEPAGIKCPKFREYSEKIFKFQRENRKNRKLRR
ncbi:MAG: NAD-dependent epimerase/dehydratase family protein [Candidatus Lokiarchaeota archaeon]|nr:NAD-dependent epimerase/dehydratase family protein [Candidatus Lokiarchaeota archaeon]